MKKLYPILAIVLVLAVVVGLAKYFYLNKPKETPKQITQNIVDFMQKMSPSDTDKEKIRSYYKPEVISKFDETNTEKDKTESSSNSESSSAPVITIKSVDENGSKATATIEMEAWIMKVPIQFKLSREGNFWKGYKWMIEDVVGIGGSNDSTTKTETTGKVNEKTAIGGDFSLKISNISDYTPDSEWDKPESGMKFVALELEYFNDSKNSDTVSPSNLTLRDSENHSYEITWSTEKKPVLESGTTVTAGGGTAKGFVTYEVPTGATISSAVYSNSAGTVTFSF